MKVCVFQILVIPWWLPQRIRLLSQGIRVSIVLELSYLLFDRIKELEAALKEREEQIEALSKVEGAFCVRPLKKLTKQSSKISMVSFIPKTRSDRRRQIEDYCRYNIAYLPLLWIKTLSAEILWLTMITSPEWRKGWERPLRKVLTRKDTKLQLWNASQHMLESYQVDTR